MLTPDQIKEFATVEEQELLQKYEEEMDEAEIFETRNPDSVGRRIAQRKFASTYRQWDHLQKKVEARQGVRLRQISPQTLPTRSQGFRA